MVLPSNEKVSGAGTASAGLPGYVTEMEDEHERPM